MAIEPRLPAGEVNSGEQHDALLVGVQATDAIHKALEEPRFLHPSSILFEVVANVWKAIVPIVFGAANWFQGGVWGIGIAGAVFVWSLVATLFRYCTLRYRIKDSEFVVTEGVLFRRVRAVPIRRIQNMDLVQNPVHRIFGVAEVRVETASGTKPEATLRVLTRQQIDELRAAIFGEREPSSTTDHQQSISRSEATVSETGVPEAGSISDGQLVASTNQQDVVAVADSARVSPAEIVSAIPLKHLVLAGLTSNRGMVLLGVVLGFFFQFNFSDQSFRSFRFNKSDLNFLRQYMPDTDDGLAFLLAVLGMFVGLLVLLRILGVAWYVLRFFGHQVTRNGDDLRISCGLFTRVSATVPRKRIQFITVHRPVLMRWLGLAAIRIETAGGAGTENENATTTVSRRWFLPVVAEPDVSGILAELRPGFEWSRESESLTWHGVSPLTEKRLLRLSFIFSTIIALIGLGVTRPWGWVAGIAVLPFLILIARKKARAKRYARPDWGIAYQSGVLNRKLSFAFHDKIQAIRVNQSPFDRRWEMASLQVDTAAAGPAEHTIEIDYLDQEFAAEQFEDLQLMAARHLPSWA